MSEKTNSGILGVNFFSLLALLFIGLKLAGKIDWPWLWVTAPLWGPLAVIFGLAFVIAAGAGIFYLV
ncbi:MAG: hypothetical protein Q8P03_01785, partial [bacterium]|nr:hypothetical protein [bacterium]